MRSKFLPPLPGGLDAADAAQGLGRELQGNVGEALHLAGRAGPGPRGIPSDVATAQGRQSSALGAGGVVALAPEVIVEDVAAGGGRSILVAEVGATSQALGRDGGGVTDAGEGEGKERQRTDEGLHGNGLGVNQLAGQQ